MATVRPPPPPYSWAVRGDPAPPTPPDAWTMALVDLGLHAPADAIEATWWIFGPYAALATLVPASTELDPVGMMARFTLAGVVPHRAHEDEVFSLVVQPVWQQWYEATAATRGVSRAVNVPPGTLPSARPRWPGRDVCAADLHNAKAAAIGELVDLNATRSHVEKHVVTIPPPKVACAYFSGAVWAVLAPPPPPAPPPPLTPSIHNFVMESPGRVRAAAPLPFITNVNAIYNLQHPRRRTKVIAQTSADHIAVHPPAPPAQSICPVFIPGRVVQERHRWLTGVYTLFIDWFVAYTMNVAHLMYLLPFFERVAPSATHALRIRARLLDVCMIDHEARMRRRVVGRLVADFSSVALVYTHPVTAEELRTWIFHALQSVYAHELYRAAAPAADSETREWMQQMRAVQDRHALSIHDIITTLQNMRAVASEEWLDEMFVAWTRTQPDYDAGDSNAPSIYAREWMHRFVKKGTAASVVTRITANAKLPSIRERLADVYNLIFMRYMISTFADPLVAAVPDSVIDRIRETDIENASAISAVEFRQSGTQWKFNDLLAFINSLWLPTVNSSANSARVDNILAKIAATGSSSYGVTYWMYRRAVLHAAHASPASTYPWAWFAEDAHRRAAMRGVYSVYRNAVARLNWHERFYLGWAIKNAPIGAPGAVISYAARLDDLETRAYVMMLREPGYMEAKCTVVPLRTIERTILHVPVVNWPQYRTWKNITVAWDAGVARDAYTHANVKFSFHYQYTFFGRVLTPPQILAGLIVDALRKNSDSFVSKTVHVRCTVSGEYVMSKRIPDLTDTVRAEFTCIFLIPDLMSY